MRARARSAPARPTRPAGRSPRALRLPAAAGTLPTQAVYVGAGALGRQALQGGVKLPKSIVALGVLATVLAIVYIGRVAQQTIAGMDLEHVADKR